MSGGISIVADRTTGIAYLQKCFERSLIEDGFAKRELLALVSVCDHPNITSVMDWWVNEERGEGGMVMEWCKLGSMDRLIKKHREKYEKIEEFFIWNWFRDLADALNYCHYGSRPESFDEFFHRKDRDGSGRYFPDIRFHEKTHGECGCKSL